MPTTRKTPTSKTTGDNVCHIHHRSTESAPVHDDVFQDMLNRLDGITAPAISFGPREMPDLDRTSFRLDTL